MNFSGPSIPNNYTLAATAPLAIWDLAIKQANRSPMIKFKVGSVLWDPSRDLIVSKGCSHPDVTFSKVLASVHAERHAIRNSRFANLEGIWCLIYTLNGRGGCAWSSRPCLSCARSLYSKNIERVIYPERASNEGWTVRSEHPEELLARAPSSVTGLFAREQRIPAY